MEKAQIIWLVILSVLYAVLIHSQINVQKQLNGMNSSIHPSKNYPTLTREYIREKDGINLSEEQYEQLAFLDLEAHGKYEAYEVLQLLKALELI
ncbi:MAG: hypothetical protein K1V97_00725 [Lachnospiraceae bacterium]